MPQTSEKDQIAHLHNHTEHSFLDGLGKVTDVAERAAREGMPAVAITDHGNLSGAWRFQIAADEHGVTPILGCEFYLAIGSRHDRDEIEVPRDEGDPDPDRDVTGTKKKRYEHLTVLAETPEGWQNLVRLNNAAHDSFFYKPRIDMDLLEQHREGLIVMTGCLGGPIASTIMHQGVDAAEQRLIEMKERLGGTGDPDSSRLFVEIMSHDIKIEDEVVRPALVDLARKHNLPLVATNDAHFVGPGQQHAHDAWLCIGTHSKITDTDRYGFANQSLGFHMRTAAEMRALFDREDNTALACDNTLAIARRIAASGRVLPEPAMRLPTFPVPDTFRPSDASIRQGHSPQLAYLYEQVAAGAKRRYGDPLPPVVRERLRFEFDEIQQKGYESYFLIVQDLVDWCRHNNIRVGPGRGSASGCTVSYSLGIVNVDPIEHDLLFERFLNPNRTSMPDIDLDFEKEHRTRVINYLRERWGEQHVAHIGTFGMTRSKAAVRDAARVLGKFDAGDKLARTIGTGPSGKPFTFAELDDTSNHGSEAFRTLVADDPDAAEIKDIASQIENVVKQEGIHACGILISDDPINDLVPARRNRSKTGIEGMLVTEWDGKDIDDFGLLKLDVLGLRNLDVLSLCVKMIEESTGEDTGHYIDNPVYDLTDDRAAAAFELLSRGATSAVFQMESSGMQNLARDIQPDTLADLAAIVALFRPGPLSAGMHTRYAARKHGREPVDYGIFTEDSPNAAAEQEVIRSVLDGTFGVAVFQEQLMQLGEVVAGFDASMRNRLQKAVSKKIQTEMDAVGEAFMTGATAEVVGEDGTVTKIAFAPTTAEKVWTAIKGAADYAFNRAHSYSYAVLAYVTAFFKANWPAHYAAAVLANTSDKDRRQAALNTLRAENVEVLAPSVNQSGPHTTVVDDRTIRVGLSEIKDVGAAGDHIANERVSTGPYGSLKDLVDRVRDDEDKPAVNSKVVTALAEAGALDELFATDTGATRRLGIASVARSLKSDIPVAVPDMEWSTVEKAARERERLKVLVSDHPLEVHERAGHLNERPVGCENNPTHLSEVPEDDKTPFCAYAVINSWTERSYSRGRMVSLTVEGPQSMMNGVIWDEDLANIRASSKTPKPGACVVLSGVTNVRTIERNVRTDGGGTVDDDEEFDDENKVFEQVRELTIHNIWPVRLPDDRRSLECLSQPDAPRHNSPNPDDDPDQKRTAKTMAGLSLSACDALIDNRRNQTDGNVTDRVTDDSDRPQFVVIDSNTRTRLLESSRISEDSDGTLIVTILPGRTILGTAIWHTIEKLCEVDEAAVRDLRPGSSWESPCRSFRFVYPHMKSPEPPAEDDSDDANVVSMLDRLHSS